MNYTAVKHKAQSNIFSEIKSFTKANTVFLIAMCAAIITSFIVTPDSEYIGYFDFKTLTCLFCTLAVICALKNIFFFTILAQKIVMAAGTTRTAVLALVYITFIGSMLIANDMALLTFLPLGYFVLSSCQKEKYMAFTFIMQNIAANLGGMLTPFGNPQNLYLYVRYNIPTSKFINIMLIPFAVSIFLITICCLIFVKSEKLEIAQKVKQELPIKRTIIYLILFAFSILIVFKFIPYYIGLIVIPAIIFFMDKNALKKVDYGLLFTFAAFFIFAGNMSRIPEVRNIIGSLISKNTLVVSALSCQMISNVPSAILLSRFSTDYAPLLVGVNIGGAGTLIASLASLITFREYTSHYKSKTKAYILKFSAFNFTFLAILLIVSSLFLFNN